MDPGQLGKDGANSGTAAVGISFSDVKILGK